MKSLSNRLESIIIALALAFPLFGTFMPLEAYLQPMSFQRIYAQRTETFDFSHIVFLIVAALTVYLIVVNSRAMLEAMRRAPLLFLLLGLTFASAAWSADAGTTIRRALRLLEYSVFGIYLFHKYDIKNFTRFITCVLAIPVFASLAILALRPDLGFSNLEGYHDAVRGAMTEKNMLGDIMSLAVLSAGYSFYIGANNRLFSGAVALGGLALLALSRSTTSVLVVIAMLGLAAYGWMVRRRAHPGWGILSAFMLVIGIAGIIGIFVEFDLVLKAVGKSATLTGRTEVWRTVIEAIRQRPFLGYGYGFWEEPSLARNNIWLELNWSPPHAHSGWLDVTLQLGMIGMFMTAVLWLVSLSRTIRLGFFTYEAGALYMGLIVVNLFIRSWTETVMIDPGAMFWLWFVVAYLHLARLTKIHEHSAILPAARNVDDKAWRHSAT